MSEYAEYEREKRLYAAGLRAKSEALDELGDRWSANFVNDLSRQIDAMSAQSWRISPKQQEVLRKIELQHGDLLTDTAKRRGLLKRREDFLERLKKLQVAGERDQWLVQFLETVNKQIAKGYPLTDKQKAALQASFKKYRIASDYSYDRR